MLSCSRSLLRSAAPLARPTPTAWTRMAAATVPGMPSMLLHAGMPAAARFSTGSDSSAEAVVAAAATTSSSGFMARLNDMIAAADVALINNSVMALSGTDGAAAATPEEEGIGPVVLTIRGLDYLHTATGLPWWGVIAACAVGLRLVVAPLYFQGIKSGAKMREIQPELKEIQDSMRAAQLAGDSTTAVALTHQMRGLLAHHGVSPLKAMGGLVAQIPLFITFVWALRRMADAAYLHPGLTTEGLPWALDLSQADPIYLLPIIGAALNLATIQINPNITDNQLMSAQTMKMVLRGMAVIFAPLTAMLPVDMHVYFVITTSTMFLQTAMLWVPAVRRALNLPKEVIPPPMAQSVPAAGPTVKLFRGPQGVSVPPPPEPLHFTPSSIADTDGAMPAAAAAVASAPKLKQLDPDAKLWRKTKGGKK